MSFFYEIMVMMITGLGIKYPKGLSKQRRTFFIVTAPLDRDLATSPRQPTAWPINACGSVKLNVFSGMNGMSQKRMGVGVWGRG